MLYDSREIFEYIKQKLAIPPKEWIKNSYILMDMLMQGRPFA